MRMMSPKGCFCRSSMPHDFRHSAIICAPPLGASPSPAARRARRATAADTVRSGWRDRLRACAWRGVASMAIATRLIGVTAAAALISTLMRRPRSPMVSPIQAARSSGPSCGALRHCGLCLSSTSSSAMGRPRFTCTLPSLLRSTDTTALSNTEHAFLFLRLARQLADIGAALDDALVAEIHRHENHRPLRVAQISCAASSTACRCAARAAVRSGCGRPSMKYSKRMAARHHETQILARTPPHTARRP